MTCFMTWITYIKHIKCETYNYTWSLSWQTTNFSSNNNWKYVVVDGSSQHVFETYFKRNRLLKFSELHFKIDVKGF